MRESAFATKTPDLLVAGSSAVRAGLLAARMRAAGLSPRAKTNLADIVTEADAAAEAGAVAHLTALRPEDGILGEEGAAREGRSGRRWVIDPVDGTYNFFSGAGPWCSALALEQTRKSQQEHDDAVSPAAPEAPGAVLASAVFVPGTGELGTGELFACADGTAALWTLAGTEPDTWNPELPAQALAGTVQQKPLAELSLATYLHPTWMRKIEVRDAWQQVAEQAAAIRMFGAGSVDLSYVAAGRIGAWMQHSVPAWDWLPGQALVEAAGGVTAQVETAGLTWSLAGGAQAVEQMRTLLQS